MSERFYRTMEFTRAASTAGGLGATLATETPVRRNGYFEVLGCSPDEVDLNRAAGNGLPLLRGHDHAGAIIGRVRELRADGRALRGTLHPATNPQAAEVWADIKAGVASDLSVGYTVNEESGKEIGKRDGLPVYRFKWAPFEVSVVNVPADAAAGIGRTLETLPLQERSKTMSGLKARFVDGKTVSFKEPKREFSLASFIRSKIGGPDAPAEDAEIRRLADSANRPAPYGEYIPFSVLRDLGTGSGALGGYIVGDDTRNDLFTDYLRAVSVAGALGVSTIPKLTGNVHVPRFTAGASGYWVAEGEAPTESTQTAGIANLTPKRVAAFIDYTRALVLQAVGLEAILRRDLSGAIGSAVDAGMLNGSGVASEPTGILQTSGIGSVSGATFSITIAASMLAAVETANVPLSGGGCGWVMPPAVAEILRKREAASGSGFLIDGNGKILSFPVYVSSSMPAATILFGNFAGGVQIAQWGPAAIDIAVDPFTGAKDQLISIIANAWLDVFVRWPGAFCKATSVS